MFVETSINDFAVGITSEYVVSETVSETVFDELSYVDNASPKPLWNHSLAILLLGDKISTEEIGVFLENSSDKLRLKKE